MKKLLPIFVLMLFSISYGYAQHLRCLPNILGCLGENERAEFNTFRDQMDMGDVMDQLSAEGYVDEFGNLLASNSQFNEFFNDLYKGLKEVDESEEAQDAYGEGFDKLGERWDDALGAIPADPNGSPEAAVDELMDPYLFPSLELATGIKPVSFDYYGNSGIHSTKPLLAIRLGTAPIYDQLWTTRWSLSGAWDSDVNPAAIRLSATEYVSDQVNSGNRPVFMEGDFALMYNPGINLKSIGHARLLTSMGMEFGTYTPDNFTTSCAAQLGTGLSYGKPGCVVYVLCTVAYGSVINSPGYSYNSKKLTTGVLIGNSVDVRYSSGVQQWAPNGNKTATTVHEFTVGLLLNKRKRADAKAFLLDCIDTFK